EKEDNVLQYTPVANVEKLTEVLNWIKHQSHEIEEFNDADHDLKRIKGVIARCSHKDLEQSFYIIKNLPTSQIMKGPTAWVLRAGALRLFDTQSAKKVPGENLLLDVGHDIFWFSPAKLMSLFGYDAKEAYIAGAKAAEIERHYK